MSKPIEGIKFDLSVRMKNPRMGFTVDYGKSRSKAIRLFCLGCMGGSVKAVRLCKSYSCPLWRFRRGAGATKRKAGHVPTQESYEKMLSGGTVETVEELLGKAYERAKDKENQVIFEDSKSRKKNKKKYEEKVNGEKKKAVKKAKRKVRKFIEPETVVEVLPSQSEKKATKKKAVKTAPKVAKKKKIVLKRKV